MIGNTGFLRREERRDHMDRKAAIRAAILTGPIIPTMLKLALPTIAALAAQSAVGIAETFYVSFLGTEAFVGVALVARS